MLKMEYFRRFPDDITLEGCRELESDEGGSRGLRRRGELVDFERFVTTLSLSLCVSFFCLTE